MKDEQKFQIIAHAVMILLSVFAILPMILMVVSSFTDNDVLIAEGYKFWPSKWSVYAYEYIFSTGNSVIRAYGVSIVLTLVGTILSLTITTMLAYTISKADLPGRGLITFVIVFSMLFNGGLVPTYIIYTNVFNIKNTFAALLIPGLLMNGFNIMLMKSYFVSSIPGEILDAAFIDGAGETMTFWKIVIPLSKPIMATIALFAGIAYWNDWMNGYIYNEENRPLLSPEPAQQNDAEYSVFVPVQFKCAERNSRSFGNSSCVCKNGNGSSRYSAHRGNVSFCSEVFCKGHYSGRCKRLIRS